MTHCAAKRPCERTGSCTPTHSAPVHRRVSSRNWLTISGSSVRRFKNRPLSFRQFVLMRIVVAPMPRNCMRAVFEEDRPALFLAEPWQRTVGLCFRKDYRRTGGAGDRNDKPRKITVKCRKWSGIL